MVINLMKGGSNMDKFKMWLGYIVAVLEAIYMAFDKMV